MKNSTIRLVIFAALILQTTIVFAGNLNPTSSPASTMKTLEQIEPAVHFSKDDLPLTIKEPGVYYLTENILYQDSGTGSGNAVISIESDGVTVDLKGYTLEGDSAGKSTAGIYSDNFNDITVKNGKVLGFTAYSVRIEGESARNNRIENITAKTASYPLVAGRYSRVTDCYVYNGSQTCIKTMEHSVISNCIISNSLNDSVNGITTGKSSIVQNCSIGFETGHAIYVDSGSRVTNCTTDHCNSYGVYATSNCTISDCNIKNTGGHAIYSSGDSLFINNIVTGGSNGLQIGYGSTARGNQINDCTTGIYAYHRCFIENNLIDDCSYGITAQGLNSIKNNHLVSYNSHGIQLNHNHNIVEQNTLTSTASIVTGFEIIGDENLYLNNRLSNTTTNINDTGSGNKDGGGNTTF